MWLLFFQLLINLIFLFFMLFMVLSIIKGAPYVRSKRTAIDAMLELAKITPHDRILDFGAGDGEVVLAFAKHGAHYVRGIELNLFLVLIANLRILFAGQWQHARVYWGNMWWFDTRSYSVIVVYGFPTIMKDLEQKLQRETSESRTILSNSFVFDTIQKRETNAGVSLYLITPKDAN